MWVINQTWTLLGWAHLSFDSSGQLKMLDNHIGYHTDSLVVGAVPEPGTWALMGF